MLPSREFMLRFRLRSWLSCPSSDCMLPWKPFFESCSLVREVRLAIQGDMIPVMPSDVRSSAVTRRGGCSLQLTPCQLQNSKDVLLHEAKMPARPESWDLKQRSARRSFSLSLDVATRLPKKARRQRSQTRHGEKTHGRAIIAVYPDCPLLEDAYIWGGKPVVPCCSTTTNSPTYGGN
jgi:hypothetical protein